MKQFGVVSFISCLLAVIPHTYGDHDSHTSNIQIKNLNNVNELWYGCEIFNVNPDFDILSVYVSSTDAESMSENDYEWVQGSKQTFKPLTYYFYFTSAHHTPLHVKIVSTDGLTLTQYNVIKNYNNDATFDFGSNFMPYLVREGGIISNEENVIVTARDSCSKHWYSLTVGNTGSHEISKVYLKECASDDNEKNWFVGEKSPWDSNTWNFAFQKKRGKSFSLNYDIKIVCKDEMYIIKKSAITSYVSGTVFNLGQNFEHSEGGRLKESALGIYAEDKAHTWWYGLTLTNVPFYIKIKSVYLGNDENEWLVGKQQHWNENTWFFSFGVTGHEWQLPYDIKVISTDGQQIINYDIINSFKYGTTFYCDTNFN